MMILGEISANEKQLKEAKVTCNQIIQNVISHEEIFLYLKEILEIF